VNRYPSNCARPTSDKRIAELRSNQSLTFAALRPMEPDAGNRRGFGKVRQTNGGPG
jgi:hypothetical protein